MSEWQPVRIAPVKVWHKAARPAQDLEEAANKAVGKIVFVKPDIGTGYCGCKVYKVKEPEQLCGVPEHEWIYECQILAD